MARICPLFSSSRGNSTYIGTGDTGVLIDVGRSTKQIEQALLANNIDISAIKAIFITHEHTDHIQGLKVFASRYNVKTFASSGTMAALAQKGVLTGKFQTEVLDEKGIELAGMFIKPFNTPHDSQQSVGYIVNTADDKRAVIATDIGYMTDTIRNATDGADVVLIESNHDVRMLQNGPYPYYLKKRILSNTGHLSNEACANELVTFIKKGITKFILAHLSQENNLPELAFETSVCHLSTQGMKQGIDYQLMVAPVANLGIKDLIF